MIVNLLELLFYVSTFYHRGSFVTDTFVVSQMFVSTYLSVWYSMRTLI